MGSARLKSPQLPDISLATVLLFFFATSRTLKLLKPNDGYSMNDLSGWLVGFFKEAKWLIT